MHNDVIFPDFSALPGTVVNSAVVHSTGVLSAAASNPAPSPIQAPETPEVPLPETANHSSPGTGVTGAGQTADPGTAAAPGPPATTRARKNRLAAPPFSWLGGDAWPHFPAWADSQA
ncbi:hypothetical protein [Arthrobacter sp. NicSoilB8]|uniref:hypothetical protein n=1 Tax=Arthrobacter sp. NicSoilB8 TaxID=2830998 RepID=UPI001CC68C60|nr:hypothetical protein [Arthrobacter sp. NicSoilB8]